MLTDEFLLLCFSVSKLLRYYRQGNVYFVTTVTKNREPLLSDNCDLFLSSLTKLQTNLDFEVVAWVLLPEHIHMIIDPKDVDISTLMKRLKLSFSYQYRRKAGLYRGHVWQPRFWDHIIRDQEDLNRHIDYIHLNPVKHGHIADPFEWKHSSLRDYYERGFYSRDWGVDEEPEFEGSFGE